MDVLVLGADEVARLLPPAAAVEAMAAAYRALARGEARVPPRSALVPPDRAGALAWMPAWFAPASGPVFGIKASTVFGRNRSTPYRSHQGAVVLFDGEHGRPLAIVEAGAITEARTAAVSALATRLLARPDAGRLALFGSGAQASAHLAALRAVRPVREVRVWSRNPDNARRFARAEAERHGLPVDAVETGRAAAAGADLICTATAARVPVLLGAWIAPGAHVNAVGASVPPFRELDGEAVRRSRLFVETREAALAEAEDIRIPLREGLIGEDHVLAELGELVERGAAGRTGPAEITLFKSVGLGLEDVAAACAVYRRAMEEGVGSRVAWGAERPG